MSNEWQDIALAPKDGTRVDLWIVPTSKHPSLAIVEAMRVPNATYSDHEWYDGKGYSVESRQWKATHFMIVEPPK